MYRLLALLTLLSQGVVAEPIRVASAANFTAPLQALVTEYKKQQVDADIRISSGSSGKLYAQIQHGAPFDVFLSADRQKPALLVQQGLSERSQTYAIGRLVLWSAEEDVNLLAQLKQGEVRRLAIANPRLAPYGLAAQQTLLALNLPANVSQVLSQRTVMGENISQTHQFIATGNADMGFIALSQIAKAQLAPPQWSGSHWLVPEVLHQPIRQDLVVLRHRRQNQQQYQLAQQFVAYLVSPQAQRLLQHYGYQAPADAD